MITRKEEEEILQPIVEQFVASQSGRFREHVSDKFLTALLMYELGRRSRYGHPDQTYANRIMAGRKDEAYEACVHIFENILEYSCGAVGNGHHVAQAFEACFNGIIEAAKSTPAPTP